MGMSVPVVLRPNEGSQPPTYTLVGECYLHKMMDGQAAYFQEERSKHLKTSIAEKRAEIAKLGQKVTSPDASEKDRSDLCQHSLDLEHDSAELTSLTSQRFELR